MAAIVRVIDALRERRPDLDALLVTDARDLLLCTSGRKLAVLKLPGFEFDEGGEFDEIPVGLSIGKKQLQTLRANLILSLAESFAPDLVYMDTLPHGKRDEMLPALRHLKRTRPGAKKVICLRDIPCTPGETFKLNGGRAKIEKHAALYDAIAVAGDPGFHDLARAYDWPDSVVAKVRYTGFVTEPTATSPLRAQWESSDIYRELQSGGGPVIVAGFGGGWDAAALAKKIIEAFGILKAGVTGSSAVPRLYLFPGPAISDADLREVQIQAHEVGGARRGAGVSDASGAVHVERVNPFFPFLLERADLAILQAGFTPFQILDSKTGDSGDIPMLLHVRDYKDKEQELRAELLQKYDGIERIELDRIEAGELARQMKHLLDSPRPVRRTGLLTDGAVEVARLLDELLGGCG